MFSLHDSTEEPTRKVDHVPTATIAFAERVKKLTEIATKQLAHDDGPHVASAVVTVAQIHALALEVLR
jgi:hypothetical protein